MLTNLPSAVALSVLIRECEDWNDTAERLAVALIREAKAAANMPSAYDDACERLRRKRFGTGGSRAVGLKLVAEWLADLADAQCRYAVPGIICKASKSVPGCPRPLRWVVGIL